MKALQYPVFPSCHAGLVRFALDVGIRHLLSPLPPSLRGAKGESALTEGGEGGEYPH